MSLVKVGMSSLLLCVSSLSFAAVEVDELQTAKSQVEDYRALRRACSITQGDQRKACFSQLHAATPAYREAKKLLSARGEVAGYPLLGQAQ